MKADPTCDTPIPSTCSRSSGLFHAPEHLFDDSAVSLSKDALALGRRLRELREDAGLTQDEVAAQTSLYQPQLSKVEKGKRYLTALAPLGAGPS